MDQIGGSRNVLSATIIPALADEIRTAGKLEIGRGRAIYMHIYNRERERERKRESPV